MIRRDYLRVASHRLWLASKQESETMVLSELATSLNYCANRGFTHPVMCASKWAGKQIRSNMRRHVCVTSLPNGRLAYSAGKLTHNSGLLVFARLLHLLLSHCSSVATLTASQRLLSYQSIIYVVKQEVTRGGSSIF